MVTLIPSRRGDATHLRLVDGRAREQANALLISLNQVASTVRALPNDVGSLRVRDDPLPRSFCRARGGT